MRLLTLLMLLLPAPATAPTTLETQPTNNSAVVVVLDGKIDDYSRASVFSRFAEARRLGAHTVILRINTYGGLVTSGLEISQFLKRQDDLHVVAYISDKAISAGAMISLACNEIVMQHGAKLGDCAPISVSGDGALQSMGAAERAKMESPILQDFEESARRNGYDPTLVQSMVSVGRVVHWIQNDAGERKFVDQQTFTRLTRDGWKVVPDLHDPIDAADTLLTVGDDAAVKLGLAKSTQVSPEAFAASRGWTIIETLAPSGGEKLVEFLSDSTLRALLTTIFLAALYTTFSHPGHGMAEVIAVTSLGVLVGVPLLTGYAQWWEILAILIGIALIALEVFVIPGFGITGISGILLLLVGLTATWVGNEPSGLPGILPQLPETWTDIQNSTLTILMAMTVSLLMWMALQRYLPQLPMFRRLVLQTTTGPVTPPNAVSIVSVGAIGRAATDLRPGGRAAFQDEKLNDSRLIDVVSDQGFVNAGAEVVIREIQGNRVTVRVV